ncbi:hypothetical protein HYU13_00065 [Candidatus Woesearchaeota archaeon]|nr:hypothetical protein [Candidatus Woesearchaeota archaeon]
MVGYLEGVLKVGNLVLAIVAGYFAVSLIKVSHSRRELKPWVLLIFGLILFALQMILGALRAFQIFESPFLTHIVPSAILGFLIAALVMQINLNKIKR